MTTLIGASALRAARRRARRARARGGRAPVGAAVDLEGAAEQAHRARRPAARPPGRARSPAPARRRRAGQGCAPRSAGTRRAASAATASRTPRRAKPSSTARTCAARRSRSAASAGSACGLSANGSSRPSSSQTCAPLLGVEAGERDEAVGAGVRPVVGVERLERLDARRPAPRARRGRRTGAVARLVAAVHRHEALRLERERGAEQRHLELGRALAAAEQARRHRQRREQPGGEVGERKPAGAARNRVARARIGEQQPRERLADQVVGRPVGVRPVASERRHAHGHAARVHRAHAVGSSPKRRARSGRQLCTSASAPAISSAAARASLGVFRSSATERLPRLSA